MRQKRILRSSVAFLSFPCGAVHARPLSLILSFPGRRNSRLVPFQQPFRASTSQLHLPSGPPLEQGTKSDGLQQPVVPSLLKTKFCSFWACVSAERLSSRPEILKKATCCCASVTVWVHGSRNGVLGIFSYRTPSAHGPGPAVVVFPLLL